MVKKVYLISFGVSSPQLAARFILCGWYFDTPLLAAGSFIRVEWISKEIGDGAGFDILSKYSNGRDKYIEVKSTKLSKETPFFFTRKELYFSIDHSNDFHLYRVFNIEEQTKMFIKKGDFNSICHSIPMTFKGYF